MKTRSTTRSAMLATTALALAAIMPSQAQAAEDEENTGGIKIITVTAQKREQSVQVVPIAVTAVDQENLQANRIFTVNDLSSIAPGVTVKPSAGGISTPAFTIRGQVSFGVVAGSDKQVSIYIDGVYISSPRGSIFQLPDIERLEVLRGPQGTLFGRNATAGAVSITTRDPDGEVGARLEGSYGNRDAYRVRATLNTPQFGPLSAYFSFVREYRRGDIQNAAAGTVWDRSAAADNNQILRSPKWLGTVRNNSYFAAVKFEPEGSPFKLVYKYDRNDDSGTPEGTGFVAWDRNAPLLGNVLTALYTSQGSTAAGQACLAATGSVVCQAPNGQRPKMVSNAWVTARDQMVQGHSLTATWEASDNITIKNIAAYREAKVFAPSAIDGVGSLTFTAETVGPLATLFGIGGLAGAGVDVTDPANGLLIFNTINTIAAGLGPQVGNRIILINSQASSTAKQWSDELIFNYNSDRLNLTAGAMWFHSKDEAGGPSGMQNTFVFPTFVPANGLMPLGKEGRYFNKATSIAAYLQVEYEVVPTLTLVLGGRITKDKKTSRFRYDVRDGDFGIFYGPIQSRSIIVPPAYKKTKPNYLIGLNWQPDNDTLVYGKFSTSFVSGGSTAGITYQPETATSWEAGLKRDWLNRRLRTNLALFYVTYNHFQSPQSTSTPSSVATVLPTLTGLYGSTVATELISSLSTFVVDQGKIRARGFELEVTALPADGLTIGGSLSYTKTTFPFINPLVLAGNNGRLDSTARPKWTASIYGSYESQPIWGDTTFMIRMDGLFRSAVQFAGNPLPQAQGGLAYADGTNAANLRTGSQWLVNGRMGLRNIEIGGAKAEFAVFGKNLFNDKDPNFSLITGLADSMNYTTARTYGVELILDF
jgi:iron complex outermembrane receptor protein